VCALTFKEIKWFIFLAAGNINDAFFSAVLFDIFSRCVKLASDAVPSPSVPINEFMPDTYQQSIIIANSGSYIFRGAPPFLLALICSLLWQPRPTVAVPLSASCCCTSAASVL